MTSPVTGVIVRWRIKVGAATKSVALRVTRPGNSTIRTGAGTSQTVTPPPDTISEFPTRLPVQAGDAIGVGDFNLQLDAFSSTPGARTLVWEPPLQDSGPPRAGANSNYELLVNADVEPDCDADGFGDETQDLQVPPGGDCPRVDRTMTLDSSKSKVKKGKKVTLSGHLDAPGNEAVCESGQSVELRRRKPSETAFVTVEQLQTDAAGNFSAKEKVKKTYQYRAQVAESANCEPAVSDTEKVKVKKKT